MTNITQILFFLGILAVSPVNAVRTMETCTAKNAQGICVEKQYLETGVEICLARDKAGNCLAKQEAGDFFLVKECTAPANGSCIASITLGDKTARCEVAHGNTCTAKAKMPAAALQFLGIK